MHKELKIIKGLQPIPGDAQTAEPGVQVVNLLNEVGIILRAGAEWVPQRPQARVVYGETPLSDGRLPLTSSVGNVVETLPVYIAGGTVQAVASAERELQRLIADARDFHTSEWQIDPVYLMWWADCAPGPQYALIYNMDLAPSGMPELQGDTWIIEATLTIERDAVWRPIPPGANPALWTEYFLELTKDPQYYEFMYYKLTTSFAPPAAFTLLNAVIGGLLGVVEYIDPANIENSVRTATIRVPAGYIPGDAPALWLFAALSQTPSAPIKCDSLHVGLDTRAPFPRTHAAMFPFPGSPLGSQTVMFRHHRLNAGDATAGSGWTKTNNGAGGLGIPGNGSTTDKYWINRTFTTAAVTEGSAMSFPGLYNLDQHTMRGRYAAFLRYQQVTGGDESVSVWLRYGTAGNNAYIITNPSTKLRLTGGSAGAVLALAYLGTVQLPLNDRMVQGTEGWGPHIVNNPANLNIDLRFAKAASATGCTVYLWDLVLMPIDEGYTHGVMAQDLGITNEGDLRALTVIDNTGYMRRGHGDYMGMVFHLPNDPPTGVGGVGIQQLLYEQRGTIPSLMPGVDNYLKVLPTWRSSTRQFDANAGSASLSDGTAFHVLPGWYGVRDR